MGDSSSIKNLNLSIIKNIENAYSRTQEKPWPWKLRVSVETAWWKSQEKERTFFLNGFCWPLAVPLCAVTRHTSDQCRLLSNQVLLLLGYSMGCDSSADPGIALCGCLVSTSGNSWKHDWRTIHRPRVWSWTPLHWRCRPMDNHYWNRRFLLYASWAILLGQVDLWRGQPQEPDWVGNSS